MSKASFFPDDRKFISPETYEAVFAVIERLEATLDRETAALDAQHHSEIAEFTRQKRQAFLELNRIARSLEHTIPSQSLIERLSTLRAKIRGNETALHRHLEALQEVTNIIVRVMQDSESDGTYSRAAAYVEWA